MKKKSRIRGLMPPIRSKKCFKIMNLMFLFTFVGLAQAFANYYTLVSTADLGLGSLQQQQSISVAGKVTDSQTGEAMPGVNIQVKGTTIGAITDGEGKYSLSVNDREATLIFSFIGYVTQEIPVAGKKTLNVVLIADFQSLEEVVVVGYGTQLRRSVTGSIASVDMSKSRDLSNVNLTQSLNTIAGVQFTGTGRPGQDGVILIRGQNSLSGSNDPLIILDGIIFSGTMADINPNDIQSIDILKDASSTSIYGSRAANGVILISSRKGTTERPTVTINAFYGLSDMGSKLKLLSPERYLQRRLDWLSQTGLEADPAKITSYLTKTEADNYTNGVSHDPWDIISQQGKIVSCDLSVSAKSAFTSYYISASMVDEKGLIFNDNQKRATIRANIDNKITEWLNLGINATFSHRNLSGLNASLQDAYRSSPYGTFYYPDGEPTTYPVPEETAGGNPIRSAILTTNEEIYDNLFSNFYALINIPFIEGLSYRLNYSPNYRWNHNYNFFRQDKYLTFNTTNASKFDQKNFDWVLENIVNYKRNIGKNHTLDLTLLYGRNHTGFESTTANAQLLSIDALGYNDLSLGQTLTTLSSGQASEGISSMARLNYQYKGKYLLTLTARRDGSSVFATNNKYATFPSAALAWIISDEQFLKKVKFIDRIKLRVSYGAAGNQAISPYQSLSLSAITQYVYGDGGITSIGAYPSTIGNNDLKWETTYTANAAVDFDLFKGRLSGTFEIFNSNTHDLLVRRNIPVMTGYNSILTNIGQTNNEGIEIVLNSVNIQRANFQWNTTATFAYIKNTIVHLFRTDLNGDGKEDDVVSNNWFIGQPINSFYDYVFDGIYQEGDNDIPAYNKPGDVRVKDLNGDGILNSEDRAVVGSGGNPKYHFSIRNNINYGNLSLSIIVNAMQGWIAPFNLINPLVPGRALGQLDAGWWTSENKSNTRPSLIYSNPLGTSWYISRDFVRIQDVSLSYQFPKGMLNKLKTSNLRVFMSGKNLYTFTKWLGSDPEGGGNFSSSQGSGDLFPMPRTFTFGINIGF